MTGLRAIMVCVDYADLLALTLPYNRAHFDEVMIVTTPRDEQTMMVADKCGARVFQTDAFFSRGALFNKWLALEKGLDEFGRFGWLCIMDADVLWPKNVAMTLRGPDDLFITMSEPHVHQDAVGYLSLIKGMLCSPLRRMHEPLSVPASEDKWKDYPIHRNVAEWAGYSQIFHADDPVLGPAPWHEVDWIHAGGADSFFQRKWAGQNKVRPPFECLHLGPAGANWFGRASKRVDGSLPEKAGELTQLMGNLWKCRDRRLPEDKRFAHEKLK